MAKADTADGTLDAPAAAAAPPAKKGGGLLPMLLAVVLSVGASAGVSWFLMQRAVAEFKAATPVEGEEQAEAAPVPKAPPVYMSIDPAFVVNLEDPSGLRFLQLQMEVMGRDAKLLEASKQHLPRIRNALLMLLGQQKIADLSTRDGKERLQAAVLAEFQKILQEETGQPVVEAVYFTSFVMQ
jgi:flagellar FliL protein